MRWLHIPLAAVLLVACAVAKGGEEPLEALKARAENAKPQDQPRLFATIAYREVSEADHLYSEGDVTNAKKAVDDLVRYAQRASEAAQKSGKHLKDTEIVLRQTARRLDDMRKTLNFEDRENIKGSVKQVENARQRLLDQMFGLSTENKK